MTLSEMGIMYEKFAIENKSCNLFRVFKIFCFILEDTEANKHICHLLVLSLNTHYTRAGQRAARLNLSHTWQEPNLLSDC